MCSRIEVATSGSNTTGTCAVLTFFAPKRRKVRSAATLPTCSGDSSRLKQRATENRSEEHTSELQSRSDLVCRLLLEKKNKSRTHQDDAVNGVVLTLVTYVETRDPTYDSVSSHMM